MNRTIIKYGVFTTVFFVAVVCFSIILNQGRSDMTMEMPEATYPVASILMDSYEINEMHGYSERMEEAALRESVTPIAENRELSFKINLFGCRFKELSFELRSIDGERLIEHTAVTDYEKDKESVRATVHLKDLIEENQEYNFVIIMTLKDGKEIYFYTRVIQCEDPLAGSKLAFVNDFHECTLQKERAKELSKYLEPNSEGDNTTFNYVNIHSSLDQVSYGDMKLTELGEPSVTICEQGNKIGTMRLNTILKEKDDSGSRVYMVEEYYRIRHTKERFYLLDYERKMEEVFVMDSSSFVNNKIVMGIQNKDIGLKESKGGNILAFVNAGRVYCYNVADNKAARLFAFFDENHFDERTYYRKSEAKILDVEDSGNITFIVYGYMNRGSHEGDVGVQVCCYNSMQNTVEEQIFIKYNKAPDIVIREVEKLSYSNRDGDLFLYADEAVHKINIASKTREVIIPDVNDDTFKTSVDNQMAVWSEEMESPDVKTLKLINLKTENVTEIQARNGETLKVIGFMDKDLVYGVVNQEDISTDLLGTRILPMKKLIIREEKGNIQKEYENQGIYVTDGTIVENQLILSRVQGSRGEEENSPLVMKKVEDDQITSNKTQNVGTNHLVSAVTELHENIQQIELKKEIEIKTIKYLTPREVMYEEGRYIRMDQPGDRKIYLVYAKGKVEAAFTDVGKAVDYAYEHVGTVTNAEGKEIYKRAETSIRNQIMAISEPGIDREKSSVAVCLDVLLEQEGVSRNTTYMLQSGESVEQIMTDNLKNCEILNLTGCPMDAILYFVNLDYPVLAVKEKDKAVLIIGFNQQNVVLMDPENGKIYKNGMNDSREMFEKAGNQFITYVPYEEN